MNDLNVIVLNKSKAQKLSCKDFSSEKVIISIRTPNDEKAVFSPDNNTIKDILYLSFYDVSTETQDIFKGYPAMTDDDAIQIKDFVLKWKDKVDTICVHCDAGISRSAGVAAGILDGLGKDSSQIFDNNMYLPNSLCYRKTLNAFKGE